MPGLRSALVAPLALLLALAPATLARAEGSVPTEVRTYVADGSLVAQLNDVYGPNADGEGIDFDDTTKPGAIERVHVWSEALRAGEDTDHPVDILNEWIVPITIADAPVGVATIWINPATVAPELASFVADPDRATALSAVPDGSSLVRDAESAAWLALAPDGTLTPLVPGSTGLSTPVPIDDVAILPAAPTGSGSTGDPGTGVGLAIAVVLLLFAVIVVALIVPGVRKKTDEAADAVVAEEETPPAVAELVAAPAPKSKPTSTKAKPPAEPDPASEPTSTSKPKPSKKKAAADPE